MSPLLVTTVLYLLLRPEDKDVAFMAGWFVAVFMWWKNTQGGTQT